MRSLWILDISESAHPRFETCVAANNRLLDRCWTYTRIQVPPVVDVGSFLKARVTLIKAARTQVNEWIAQGLLNDNTFTVCVVGDIRSDLTRTLLPFVSIVYKLHWEKVLPLNTNIGLKLCGFFYCPYQINQFNREEQDKYALFFEELNQIQGRKSLGRYDLLVPYSDIQPIGSQSYPQLDADQKDELLFEYLQTLFSHNNPAGMETLANDAGCFFSIGAASSFYDPNYFKQIAINKIQNELVCLFKEKKDLSDISCDFISRLEKERNVILSPFREENSIIRKSHVLKTLNVPDADITADFRQVEKEQVFHPVWNFYKPLLYPRYYLHILRYYPARVKEYMQFYTNALRKRMITHVENAAEGLMRRTYDFIDHRMEELWSSKTIRYKTLSQAESILEELKVELKEESDSALAEIQSIGCSPLSIPNFLSPHAQEVTLEGTDFKKLLGRLKSVLQKEPTFLAATVRCLLVGTTAVFCLLPLLRALSPRFINLGTISSADPFWMGVIYAIPFIYMLGWMLRRHFKQIRLLQHKIWAYTLLALRQELSDKLSEITKTHYDTVCEYCDQLLISIGQIRESYQLGTVFESRRYLQTFFNQSVLSEKTAGLMNIQIRFGSSEVQSLASDEDRYRLLSVILSEMDKGLLGKQKDENDTVQERLKRHREQMYEQIQNRIQFNEYESITDFLTATIHNSEESKELITTLLKKAYPVGLYVDSSNMKHISRLRMKKSCTLEKVPYQIVQDVNEDKDVLTCYYLKPLKELNTSHFLSIGNDHTNVDFTAQLLCYYYFYRSEHRGGMFQGQDYPMDVLQALDRELSVGEDQI